MIITICAIVAAIGLLSWLTGGNRPGEGKR